MHDVAIVGVGLHPFGRFGPKSAIEMAAEAVRAACADAGVAWNDIQFAFGGSAEVDNPDAVIGLLGLTGIPFMDVYNGCATAATALEMTADAIRFGKYDLGVAVGMDKHLPGALTSDPIYYGAPGWYGDPNAFRRKPIAEEEVLASRMLNYPLTQYMFCAPNEGAAAAVLCRADIAHRYTSTPVFLRASALRTRRYGAYEVHSTWAAVEKDDAPTVYASRAAFEAAGLGPDDVDIVQLQDTDAGAEVIHMAENGFCAHGDQEKLVAEGATEIGGPLPINTDGGLIANGEPVGASGLRQVHGLVRQLRGQAGERQVPGTPRVGYAQLYGAPGTAAVSILTT